MDIITTSIPDYLKQFNHWLCWKYETRNDKATKVPKNPHTGDNGSSTDPSSWAGFEQALAAQQKYNFDGIGFALAREKVGLVGIDLDDCVTAGQLTPLAAHIVATLNSYTEITPSGAGLRIFALADLPPGRRKDTSQGVEMYDGGRYLTVTGRHWPGTPRTIERRPQQVLAIHQQVFPEVCTPTPPSPVQPVGIDDQQLLNLAISAKNGNHFALLWNGQWAGNGWASHSEADQALANYLAFWTGNDAHRIDMLFRQSGLMREKWDRKTGETTYGQITIDRAISDTKEVYIPPVDISVNDIILSKPDPPPPDRLAQLFPHYTLSEGMALPPPDYLIYGAVAKGDIGMLFGDSSAGKSYLAIDMAVALAAGQPWMGEWDIQQPYSVLYFTAEGQRSFFRRVAAAAQNGTALIEKNLTVVTAVPQLFSDRAERFVGNYVKLYQQQGSPSYDFVVLDTLHKASVGGDENLPKEAGIITSRATWLQEQLGQPALMLVHHVNKKGGYRGSSSFKADMDFMLKLEGQHREPRILTIDKLRDFEPDGLQGGESRVAMFKVDDKAGQSYVTWLAPDEADTILNPPDKRQVARNEAREEIIDIVASTDGMLAKTHLAERVQAVSFNTAKKLIDEMMARGELIGHKNGRATYYTLPQRGAS